MILKFLCIMDDVDPMYFDTDGTGAYDPVDMDELGLEDISISVKSDYTVI